ncbi:dihydrofolate reductase [Niveibacterium sp. SC-1]|uniref:dihydrofolate reductase n=1 Tax=Niveibacterium sp. SC-1 TaxID=3135646 RepID=UPI00311F330E
MSAPQVWLIAARDRNGAIGRDGGIPWRQRADMQRLKALTMGSPIVMGRKTWESFGRPLPGRKNIVITRAKDYVAEGALVVHSLDEAIAEAGAVERVWILGGGEIYRLAMDRADAIELTEVDCAIEGEDAHFPAIDATRFAELARESHAADERNEHAYSFVSYRRR